MKTKREVSFDFTLERKATTTLSRKLILRDGRI